MRFRQEFGIILASFQAQKRKREPQGKKKLINEMKWMKFDCLFSIPPSINLYFDSICKLIKIRLSWKNAAEWKRKQTSNWIQSFPRQLQSHSISSFHSPGFNQQSNLILIQSFCEWNESRFNFILPGEERRLNEEEIEAGINLIMFFVFAGSLSIPP